MKITNCFKRMLIAHIFTALFLTPVIIGLTGAEAKDSTLIIGIENSISKLDPLTMKDPYTFRVGWQIFEGLVGLDENGNTIPKLAERWEVSEDHKEWTFFLRKDVFFQTSDIFDNPRKTRKVTGEDVLMSLTGYCSSRAYPAFMLLDSIKGAREYNQGKADRVEGLQIIDPYTVKIVLRESEPFFLDRINSPWFGIFPKEMIQAPNPSWGETVVVGTGPYKLVKKTDNIAILNRNKEYWRKGFPKIDKIVFRVIRNDQLRFLELRKGNINFMLIPKSLLPEVVDSNGAIRETYKDDFNAELFSSFNSHFIGINLSKVTDKHLRKAISLAINRQEIVDQVLRKLGKVNIGTIPLNMQGFPNSEKRYYQTDIFNMAMAREELKKSSYNGKEIELLVHDKEGSQEIGEIVQFYLKRIGVAIKLVKLDYNSLLEKMLKGDTELFNFFADYVFSSPEPLLSNMFTSSKIPIPNVWAFDNKTIDKEINSLRHIANREVSFQRSLSIQKQILDAVPAAFLFQQRNLILYDSDFRNLKVNGYFHYMLDEIEKKTK